VVGAGYIAVEMSQVFVYQITPIISILVQSGLIHKCGVLFKISARKELEHLYIYSCQKRSNWGYIFCQLPAQSRQSAKLFLKSSELGLPQPLTRRRVCPLPPPVLGGRGHSLAIEGLGESQFRRGDIHCGTLYIYTYFVVASEIEMK
jgi:hypothetical protein